jgi:hypothetical protein
VILPLARPPQALSLEHTVLLTWFIINPSKVGAPSGEHVSYILELHWVCEIVSCKVLGMYEIEVRRIKL